MALKKGTRLILWITALGALIFMAATAAIALILFADLPSFQKDGVWIEMKLSGPISDGPRADSVIVDPENIPLTIHDLHTASSIEIELARDSIIEKISYLAVSYFCVSTELRFLVNLKDNPNVDPVQVRAESEFWHGKALEISCTFLPSESPLVSHIYSSYKKHHAPVNQVIPEEPPVDQEDGGEGGAPNHKTSKNSKNTKSNT